MNAFIILGLILLYLSISLAVSVYYDRKHDVNLSVFAFFIWPLNIMYLLIRKPIWIFLDWLQ